MTTPKTIASLIAEVKRLDAVATPGPWKPSVGERVDPGYYSAEFGQGPHLAAYWEPGVDGKRVTPSAKMDAEFIAAARTALPILARALELAISQRDGWIRRYDFPHYKEIEAQITKDNAALDRLVSVEGE